MALYDAFAIITVLAALFGYINYRFIRLPGTIGIMLISLLFSFILILIGLAAPSVVSGVTGVVRGIDFYTMLMRIMLSFLLFAGAIHLDGRSMRSQRAAILTFSTIGTILSTFIVGSLLFGASRAMGYPIGFVYCLLFG